MKKSDLRSGMVIENRKGDKRVLVDINHDEESKSAQIGIGLNAEESN